MSSGLQLESLRQPGGKGDPDLLVKSRFLIAWNMNEGRKEPYGNLD